MTMCSVTRSFGSLSNFLCDKIHKGLRNRLILRENQSILYDYIISKICWKKKNLPKSRYAIYSWHVPLEK